MGEIKVKEQQKFLTQFFVKNSIGIRSPFFLNFVKGPKFKQKLDWNLKFEKLTVFNTLLSNFIDHFDQLTF